MRSRLREPIIRDCAIADRLTELADRLEGLVPATATYDLQGRIRVDGTEVGTYDADGATWKQETKDVLVGLGYRTVGDWSTDEDYTSTITVKVDETLGSSGPLPSPPDLA